MRRLLAFTMALCLLFAGCDSGQGKSEGNSVTFYYEYKNAGDLADDSVIGRENRNTYASALAPVLEL